MCKIIVLTNASKINGFDVFSRYCSEILSDMRDGFGYAAQGEGGVFGYRTVSPQLYSRAIPIPDFCESHGQDFGTKTTVTGAAIFHGRTSTNQVNLINTHPIERDQWYLIHNGVVTHHGEKYSMKTTNDSEHILFNLIQGGIDQVANSITGYYAGGAIDNTGKLHVFRDDIAQLYYAYSNKLKSGVFATTTDLIAQIGDFIKEELVPAKVKSNTYLVYDGDKLLEKRAFTSRGYDKHSSLLSTRSLGYDLENTEEYDSPVYDISDLDNSFTYHHGFKELTHEEFISLDFYDQADCVVKRDGVSIDWVLN